MLKKLAQKFISFKKKDENSALISVGLFIMVMAVFLIKMGNRHLPEEWKSGVEIWGTVSDWFVVIITLVTAVFLYKTLRSQMEVQKDQTRLFKIEELKYLREIKPRLELQISKVSIFEEDFLTHLEISFNLSVEKAKNINHKIYTSNNPFQPSYSAGNKIKKFNLKNQNESSASGKFPRLFIEIKYADSDGNEYLYKDEILYLDVDNIISGKYLHKSDKLIKPMY